MFLELAILTCIIWCFKFIREKLKLIRKVSAIPNAKTGRFGAIGDFVGKSVDGCLKQILKYFHEGPEIQKAWFGNYLVVAVSKPEYLEVIMTSRNSLSRTPLIGFLRPYLGDGIFTAEGDTWKNNRRLINPCFNQKVLNTFIPIFSEECDILISELEKHVGHHDIDIRKIFSSYTLDVICRTALGATVKAQTNEEHYAENLRDFLEVGTIRMFNPFYHPQIIFDMTKLGKMCKKLAADLAVFSQNILTERKSSIEQNIMQRMEYNENEGDESCKIFLDTLVEETHRGRGFTDEQLRDEVHTLLAAGTDTTAITLSYCCVTLGMHPDYQQKIYEEAVEVFGDNGNITHEDLTKLNLTEMFIKETLRIFPIVPLNIRMAAEDVILDDNLVIPKDTMILMSPLHLQRSPQNWEDPLKFDPYRFSPENIIKTHPFSYLPFSRGPRNCIGAKYAMMNLKFVLSNIVRKFTVKTDYRCLEDVELTMKLLSCPSDGFKISLEQRK